MKARVLAGLVAVLVAAPIATCAANSSDETALTVVAAASLQDVLTEVGARYEDENPEARLRFSFAGSQELAAQVRNGLPADVVVTADDETMDRIAVREPVIVATNLLTIVTASGNPHGIAGLADLSDPELAVVLAAPDVPVGRYSRDVLEAAGVDLTPVSEEASVRAVLSKVALGEADAGIVYVTDAAGTSGQNVTEVPIPRADNVTTTYPGAVLSDSEHAERASGFLHWLSTGGADDALRSAGFGLP